MKILNELQTMSRAELIAAKEELTADVEIPRKEKGQIMAQIDAQLSALKNKLKQSGGWFYSFMDGGESLSCISRLPVGQFIVLAEPDAMISSFPLTEDEYGEMKDKDWQEFT